MVFLEKSSLERRTERQIMAKICFFDTVASDSAFDALLGLMGLEQGNYPEFEIEERSENGYPVLLLKDISGQMFDTFCNILTQNNVNYALDITDEVDLQRAKLSRGTSYGRRRQTQT